MSSSAFGPAGSLFLLPPGGGWEGVGGQENMKDRDYSPRLKAFADEMRHQPTDAERRLWHILRAGRIEGLHFRRPHPIRGYILDFYCNELKLAIEADGCQHYSPEGKQHDLQREKALAAAGVLCVRVSDYDVLKNTDGVGETLYWKCVPCTLR